MCRISLLNLKKSLAFTGCASWWMNFNTDIKLCTCSTIRFRRQTGSHHKINSPDLIVMSIVLPFFHRFGKDITGERTSGQQIESDRFPGSNMHCTIQGEYTGYYCFDCFDSLKFNTVTANNSSTNYFRWRFRRIHW